MNDDLVKAVGKALWHNEQAAFLSEVERCYTAINGLRNVAHGDDWDGKLLPAFEHFKACMQRLEASFNRLA